MRYQGRLTQWNDDKGFGFITPNDRGERVFVHIKSFRSRQRRPAENALLTYVLQADDRGRPRADEVDFASRAKAIVAPPRRDSSLPPLLAVAFVTVLGLAAFAGRLPLTLFGLYAAASLVAFLMYLWDKISAEKGARRTPENSLHLVALVGGWPGAVFAQRHYRHKTQKASFRRVFWITVALNCIATGWLATAPSATGLRALLGGA